MFVYRRELTLENEAENSSYLWPQNSNFEAAEKLGYIFLSNIPTTEIIHFNWIFGGQNYNLQLEEITEALTLQ